MFKKETLGFTLIELLIVIAIIGILAVAFLPSILGAPAKGRDTARVADIQKIQKVLINANLEGKQYPASGCMVDGFGGTDSDYYLTQFGGALPVDPQNVGPNTCTTSYQYVKSPSADYAFALISKVEIVENANANCATAATGGLGTVDPAQSSTWCYAVFNQ